MVEYKNSIYDFDDHSSSSGGSHHSQPDRSHTATIAYLPPPMAVSSPSYVSYSAVPSAPPAEFDTASDLYLNENINDNTDDEYDVTVPPTEDEYEVPPIPVLPEDGVTDEHTKARRMGAGIASGLVGLCLGGPLLGAIVGLGAAYATEREDAVGSVARSIGDVALLVKDHAVEIDRKHHVMDHTKARAACAWEKTRRLAKRSKFWKRARKMDKKHHVMERTHILAVMVVAKTMSMVKHNHMIEQGVAFVGTKVMGAIRGIVHHIEHRPGGH